ncbi:MAG TPA: enolase C-terminal domain-like protein [Burkholderiales bacterium]|nr:enolase C-terminal domain-like protein [Burkholderiales bacterium]
MRIERVAVAAYRIPTDGHESDGTYAWDATTLVVARIAGGGHEGLGYTYADGATARLIADVLAPELQGADPLAINARWIALTAAVRNLGRPGIASMAISAVDVALWDLKAKLLGVSLAALLGPAREAVPVYGSGGFTSYTVKRLQEQLSGWAASGIMRVKMKVGRAPEQDIDRVRAARRAIGDRVELFVDANGAYAAKQALAFAHAFAASAVTWFEEPVSSDDLPGLRMLRDRGPAGMSISAGEYGYDLPYFRRMLDAQAVDVLQADATRCGGVTGFLDVAAVCDAYGVPLSSHCAPSLHAPLCCAARRAVHLEYFHDHVRIEQRYFDGAAVASDGVIRCDASRPGLGLEFKEQDASCYSL